MLSLGQLRSIPTADSVLETILEHLTSVGFNAKSWAPTSLQRKFLMVFAIVYANLASFVASLAAIVYNDTAEGDALTAYSKSNYENQRKPAVATIGQMIATNAGAVPHTVAASDLVVSFTEPDGTTLRTFRNTSGGTVAAGGGTLTMDWVAETAGSAWNIPNDSPLTLLTNLAGVEMTNPLIAGTDTWITTLGADQENDAALKLRNSTKWASLSLILIHDGVVNVALNAAAGVRRVGVDDQNPDGAGSVDVYVAGASATAGATDVAAVLAALKKRFLRPAKLRVFAASPVFLDLTGIVYYDAKYSLADVRNAVEGSGGVLVDLLTIIPLGGFDFSPGPASLVPKNDIEAAIKEAKVAGKAAIKTVTLSVPSGDLSVLSFGVVVKGVWNLTYTAVAA
jgi:hypothetical protein